MSPLAALITPRTPYRTEWVVVTYRWADGTTVRLGRSVSPN